MIAVTTLVVMSPVLAKNWSVSRSLSIQGYGGLNAYIGDSPRHDGRATFRLGAGLGRAQRRGAARGHQRSRRPGPLLPGENLGRNQARTGTIRRAARLKTLWLVQSEEARDAQQLLLFH